MFPVLVILLTMMSLPFCIAFATIPVCALVLFFPFFRFVVIKLSTTHGAAHFPLLIEVMLPTLLDKTGSI